MKILTIIVSYNFEKWIDKCLGSLFSSEYPTEILVVDNCSKDNTVRIIKDKWKNVRLIESNSNLGFGKANNIGFEIAIKEKFDAVFLLNQDSWIDRGLSKTENNTQDAAGDKRQAQQGIKDTGATSPELMNECGGATRVKIPIEIE